MAQLRTALRAYAIDAHPPAEVVARVNRMMWALGPTAMTTLVYIVLDPVRETIEMVNAGHPPALVIGPGGDASYLPPQGGVALGASPVARYRCDTYPFPLGSTLVLYTDGLVERRGASIDAGLDRLRALTGDAGGPERLCDAIVEQLVPDAPADDIAIIVARLPALPEELRGRWPAEKEALADVRALLRRWLYAQGATEDEAYDITVASQEACANAVEHAYGPERRSFEVEATYSEGCVRVVVRDDGRWRPPRGDNRGRGLPLMQALMEYVEVTHGGAGTVVVLERTLSSSAA
jgi:anti-sigma regulatory factor (Ser/Thr protein kinase)